MTGAEIANWLGVPNDAAAIERLLWVGKIPYTNAVTNPDGTLASIEVLHFYAALQLSGTWYYFDPSFKSHTVSAGLSSLASALGYNRTQFLSDAGGTIGSYSISSINRSNLRADLTGYATNLVNYINQNNRTWSIDDVIGGQTIQPLTGSPIRQQYPSLTPSATFPVDCPNQTPSNVECRTYVTITMPGASSSQAIKLYTDQVYGHRITVFSVPSGSNDVPTLLIDGAVPSCVGAGTCTNVGPPEAPGTKWLIPVTVTEPNQPTGSSCTTGVTACKTLTITAGGSYLISMGVGQVGRGMAEYHRQLLAQARAAGNLDGSEIVLGENLAAISFNWLAEFSAEQQITDKLAQTTTVYQFGIGITGQNTIQSGLQGPYVDLPVNIVTPTPWASNGPTVVIGGHSYPLAFFAAFFTSTEMASAFESAVLEQTQAPVADMTAASTIKIIDANMDPSESGSGSLGTTYFANGTTGAGQAAFTSTIAPAIEPHYSPGDYNSITAAVMAGQQLLLPEQGQLSIGQWSGAGYTLINPSTLDVSQFISGGMSGGFSGRNIPDPAPNTQDTLNPPASTDTVPPLLNNTSSPGNPRLLEPVDGITGTYVYQHNDLTTGRGNFPYALPFARTYLSSSGSSLTTTTADIGMGNGWGHTYSAKAQIESDPYIGLGVSDSPAVSAATSIAALYVMQDLLSVTPTAQTMTVSSMVARWLTDQLTGNALMVTKPDTTEEFTELPHADGSTNFAFNPPPGSSAQVAQTIPGQFTYRQKDGVTLTFGPTPSGALQSWVFPNGVTVALTYSGSLSGSPLLRVSNNLGRSLTFSYPSNPANDIDIASVTDDTGRTVTYGYDAQHDLTSMTDPLGAVTTYGYDTSGTYDTVGHLTQVFYPSLPTTAFVTNWYDALGRVARQANANGNISDFYFAGSRTELVDALGNRHITYQTDRGKVLRDIQVLSSSVGTVFDDTPQQNGLVNVTTNQYDGLDRPTLTTLPEGGTKSYTYVTALNPWANNIASITRTPKPGSSLAPLTTSFTYDATYNKPTTIIDPRGLLTRMSYDAATGNLVSIVADVGTAPHLNATTRFTYDTHGQVLTATDPLGTVTDYAYDGSGNPTSITRDYGRLNQLTIMAYSASGDVTAVTDPNGNTTRSIYDADRRLVSSTTPPAPVPLVTTISYDPDGRVLATQQSADGTVLRTTRASYTPTGQTATTTDAKGGITRFAYDSDDRLSSVTDPVGRVTGYAYDAMGRRTGLTNAAIQVAPLARWAYTPDGLVASLTDANGHATSLAYDGFDRLSTTTYPDASTEGLGYDADDNVVSRKTRKGDTITFAYDTLNRLATKTPPAPAPVVSYAYDLAGHLIGVSDTSASITVPTGSSASYATSLRYDALNRPLGVSYSPAPSQAAPAASAVTFAYGYDATNRRISQTATDKGWWSYPGAAATVSYTANALSQYSAVGSVTPSYDGNGNLTFDGTFSYGYDAEGRLISLTQGSTAVASYAYDAQGRRKLKTVGSTSTIYVTDADNREVLEYDGASGQVLRWYAYGLGPDDVLDQMNLAAGTRETLIPDVQGSVIGALDSGSGALTTIGYQAYGENPSLSSGTYRYTARRFDAETAGSAAEPSGLYYYRARMYSPTLGRFLQPDPVGYAGGTNLYAYTDNDPLNLTDPSGNCPWCVAGAVIGFGVDLGAQYLQARNAGVAFHVDWTRSAVATVTGALTGGASAWVGGAVEGAGVAAFAVRTTANAAIGASGNVGQTAELNDLENKNDSLISAAEWGAGLGAAGSALGDIGTAASSTVKQYLYNTASAGEKNFINSAADLNANYNPFAPTPGAVAVSGAAANAIGASAAFSGK